MRHKRLELHLQGIGKRVLIASFAMRKTRVGKGLKALRVKDGDSLAAAVFVGVPQGNSGEDLLISTVNGMLIRVPVSQTMISSRTSQGHRIVKLKEGDEIGTVTHIVNQEG
jgi:DNA gyrase subunit A